MVAESFFSCDGRQTGAGGTTRPSGRAGTAQHYDIGVVAYWIQMLPRSGEQWGASGSSSTLLSLALGSQAAEWDAVRYRQHFFHSARALGHAGDKLRSFSVEGGVSIVISGIGPQRRDGMAPWLPRE